MTENSTSTAGIDTGKDKLDVAVHGTNVSFRVPNTRAGWVCLARQCAQIGVCRVGIEATGGYERGVTRHLQQAGMTVLLLQPVQVKAYAKLHLKRAKNDRIDAVLIAACAHIMSAPRLAPDPRLDQLADQLTFVEQIE